MKVNPLLIIAIIINFFLNNFYFMMMNYLKKNQKNLQFNLIITYFH